MFKRAVNGSGRTNREEKEQLQGSVEMEEAHHITLNYQSKEIVGYQDAKCQRDVAKQKQWNKDKDDEKLFKNNLHGKQGGRKDVTKVLIVRKTGKRKKKV